MSEGDQPTQQSEPQDERQLSPENPPLNADPADDPIFPLPTMEDITADRGPADRRRRPS